MTQPGTKKKRNKTIKKIVLKEIRDIFIFIGLVILFKTYIIDIGVISGHSMEPNLKDGQLIVLKKWDIHFGGQNKGVHFYDEVVLENVKFKELEQPINIAKRVIGLPGDRIQIINGELYRNGEKVIEPLIKEKMNQPNQTFTVGKNEVFIMGDNRNHSTDSREIGPIPIEKVTGEIIGHYDARWYLTLNQEIRSFLHIKTPV